MRSVAGVLANVVRRVGYGAWGLDARVMFGLCCYVLLCACVFLCCFLLLCAVMLCSAVMLCCVFYVVLCCVGLPRFA